MHPFEPRAIEFHGVHRRGDWRAKLYSVVCGTDPIDWSVFSPGLSLAEAALPRPAVDEGRPGVGFLIAHQGRTDNYVVLGWWDRENELPLRVFVSPDARAESWRPGRGGESVCVWDLEIIWAERQAYVDTMLKACSDIDAYLARACRDAR